LQEVDMIAGRGEAKTTIKWNDQYLSVGFQPDGPDSNRGGVFANVVSAKMNFPGEKSGGLIDPSIQISNISRLTGPVGGKPTDFTIAGTEPDFVKGIFNPKQF